MAGIGGESGKLAWLPGLGPVGPFRKQLLKWIGNKQRFAHEIVSYFPGKVGRYFEPFLGSGAVLATLQPPDALASDAFGPLIEIWQTLSADPRLLVEWYAQRYEEFHSLPRPQGYLQIRERYNRQPNGADLLFLCRSCYGGVVRMRASGDYMTTPCGVHRPVSPDSFAERVAIWHRRTRGAQFAQLDFAEAMAQAQRGDLVYCDPPYSHSESCLYRGQSFKLDKLFAAIASCKERGVLVAMSIDGSKKSGRVDCPLDMPPGLFRRELFVNCGRSMLRRFQKEGESVADEVVHDRLLLTW